MWLEMWLEKKGVQSCGLSEMWPEMWLEKFRGGGLWIVNQLTAVCQSMNEGDGVVN